MGVLSRQGVPITIALWQKKSQWESCVVSWFQYLISTWLQPGERERDAHLNRFNGFALAKVVLIR
jgi:hypothetical protein